MKKPSASRVANFMDDQRHHRGNENIRLIEAVELRDGTMVVLYYEWSTRPIDLSDGEVKFHVSRRFACLDKTNAHVYNGIIKSWFQDKVPKSPGGTL